MNTRKSLHIVLSLLVLLSLIFAGNVPASAQSDASADRIAQNKEKDKKLKFKDFKKAAARALYEGALNPLMVGMEAGTPAMPGEAPRYFSHPNYANSPLPTITTTPAALTYVGNPLIERGYATDNAANVFVVNPNPLPAGFLESFQSWNQATAGGSFAASAGLQFHAYVLRPTGNPDEYLVFFDSGLLTVPP